MKKKSIRYFVHLLISILFSFIVIYLIMFSGAWRLFEPADPFKIEIAVAIVAGTIIFLTYEVTKSIELKIKVLENHVNELEKRVNSNLK